MRHLKTMWGLFKPTCLENQGWIWVTKSEESRWSWDLKPPKFYHILLKSAPTHTALSSLLRTTKSSGNQRDLQKQKVQNLLTLQLSKDNTSYPIAIPEIAAFLWSTFATDDHFEMQKNTGAIERCMWVKSRLPLWWLEKRQNFDGKSLLTIWEHDTS